jgi:type IV pilus assembly protein PilA
MFRLIRKRMKGEKGFTLIELLVVIIIIAILAAIAIPTFLGQRQKAYDAAAKSLVRNAMTSMESYYVDSRTFVGADAAPVAPATVGPLGLIEPTITWVYQATGAASTATADAGVNAVNFGNLGANTYEIGSVSKSGKVWGVAVDKSTGPGIVWYKAGSPGSW